MIIIKSDKEIGLIREGGKILASILDELESMITPGLVTSKIDKTALRLAKENNAKPSFKGYRGYPANICVSVNQEVVHCLPKARKLKEGDIVGLDFGLLYKGYYTDMARTIPCGKISDEAQKLIDITKKSLNLGIQQIKPGAHIGDISAAVQEHVEKNELTVVRDLVGHGVGKEVHEPPQIPNYGKAGTGPKLKKGMVIAIEPMVNIGGHEIKLMDDGWSFVTSDGELSAHFEHTVAVTSSGYDILTVK